MFHSRPLLQGPRGLRSRILKAQPRQVSKRNLHDKRYAQAEEYFEVVYKLLARRGEGEEFGDWKV